jgi:hypothetical protein
MQFAKKYSSALELLIERKLVPADGMKISFLAACEQRLKLKLPASLRDYYALAGWSRAEQGT